MPRFLFSSEKQYDITENKKWGLNYLFLQNRALIDVNVFRHACASNQKEAILNVHLIFDGA